ncbi:MAG: penicillin acylase family protein, partial [Candidatus Dormibacteria bacterium]
PLSSASNVWVLAPARTAEGSTIVLSDPHGPIAEFQMYEFTMEAGDLHTCGVTAVGACLPALGHNRNVAWGLTTGAPLVADCYRIEMEGDSLVSYLYDGEPRELVHHVETIGVLGEEPRELALHYAHINGALAPVVARDGRAAFVVSTPYMEEAALLDEQLYAWHRAASVGAFKEAMRPLGMLAMNTMVADNHGDSWFVRVGRTPIRAEGTDPHLPLDGNSSRTAWLGIHSLDDLVQVRSPAEGYMQNCNCSPDVMLLGTPKAELAADSYRSYIFNDRPGRNSSRGERALELLSSVSAATIETVLDIALDLKWPRTELWQRALDAALESRSQALQPDPDLDRIARSIAAFDGFAKPGSASALHYATWRQAVCVSKTADIRELPDLVAAVERGDSLTDAQEDLLAKALAAAMLVVKTTPHGLATTYGDMHRIGKGGASWPAGGGFIISRPPDNPKDPDSISDVIVAPLRVMGFGAPDSDGRAWATVGGRSLRLTVLGDKVQSYSAVLFGQSGKPDSPHYSDQASLVSDGRLRLVPFYRDAVENEAVATLKLDVPATAEVV